MSNQKKIEEKRKRNPHNQKEQKTSKLQKIYTPLYSNHQKVLEKTKEKVKQTKSYRAR
jgi:hypothetical protein